MSGTTHARRRVLFLYNVPDWAIHHVGLDWASEITDTHEVKLVRYGRHENERPETWDHVVWGYSTLDYSGRARLASLLERPLGWGRWRRPSPRFAAVIQDPSELFDEAPDWRTRAPRTAHLARFRRLAVTSNEMLAVTRRLGLETVKVNTRSRLPLRDAATLVPERLRVVTRAVEYPRKNLALFRSLRARLCATVERFDEILGRQVSTEAEYARLLDGYNVYVCTSWQEGGPLPLMDAQRRGCVVLTTRVGQTDERVVDGENGFFCDTEDEFVRRLAMLRDDPERLFHMRRCALERAAADLGPSIRAQLRAFLP